jgi:4-hydroxy-tetrahydrodipicolinate reductase
VIRVGVIGAAGRMGNLVCRAVADDPDLEVVAAVVRPGSHAAPPAPAGLAATDDFESLASSGAEVAVDFTRPDAVMANIRWLLGHGIHAVVGTTGIRPEDVDELRDLSASSGANVVIASNFAVGAVLMQRVAELVAPHMPAVEIIELHHDGKLDAPSGTALSTARRVATARGGPWSGPGGETVPGARGGEVDGIRVHSVRLPGLVAHQEVIFGAPGQTLTIRHDAPDRTCYMPGVVLAVKAVASRPGVTVGLEPILGV